MSTADVNRMITAARIMDKRGQLDFAIQLYLKAGEPKEAARILADNGRHGDAGQLLLKYVGVEVGNIGKPTGINRKYVYLAANYLAKGDDPQGAIQILAALGEREKAADLLEREGDLLSAQRLRSKSKGFTAHEGEGKGPRLRGSGSSGSKSAAEKLEREGKLDLAVMSYVQIRRYGDAGRILKGMGKLEKAAEMYTEAGMPYEAAECFFRLGDAENGLSKLVTVPREDRRYRNAAAHAVRVASGLNAIDFQLEHFLTKFIGTGPSDENEVEVFYLLSRLYENHNLLENAKEVLKKVVSSSPKFRDAAERLTNIENRTKVGSNIYDKILKEEESFRGERGASNPKPLPTKLPSLPPLPEIPQPLQEAPAAYPSVAMPAPQPQGSGIAATMQIPGLGGAGAPYPAVPQVPAAPAVPDSDPGFVVGNVIADRYQIDEMIGQGGMATVFKATDLELEDKVALKVFNQPLHDPKAQEESLSRFKLELKLSRQLMHPNVIRLYDIGMHSGHRYISMELLIGKSLEDVLEEQIDIPRGLWYLIQAAAGLQSAHDKGVIHRDVKPDNLFVTKEETVKVMDFGIAKTGMQRGVTVAGMMAGTPEYMAPEQITDFSNVTASADMYSLGVVAYRMFTGVVPFQHEELVPLLMMHVQQPPRPLREIKPDVPEDLEKVVLRMMGKKPEARFEDLRDLARYLQHIRSRYAQGGR